MANPRPKGGFKPGQSGNPSGRAKIPIEIRDMARAHTVDAIKALVEVMQNSKASPSARVSAATAILDRGWGRPAVYDQEGNGVGDGAEVHVHVSFVAPQHRED